MQVLGSWLSSGHVPSDSEHSKASTVAIIDEFDVIAREPGLLVVAR